MTTEINTQHMTGLSGAAEAMIGGSAKNLSQLLGAEVEFHLLDISGDTAQVPEVIEDGVHLSVGFDGALSGDSWLVLSGDDATSIVQMMAEGMGMEISDEVVLGELGMSALSEAMNQLMAGAATALSDGLGERIDISPPSISTSPEPQTELSDTIVVTYEGQIGSEARSKLFWQIDAGLAGDLGERWLAATGGPATPAPAPQPAAAQPAAPAPAPTPAPPLGGGVINTVELDVAVELGNVAMTVGELLRMGEGSVVTLTQSVGDNVVMLANGTPVASGEVVVVDGVLGFRVADLITEAKGA